MAAPEDPVEILEDAADSTDRTERILGYQRALAAVDASAQRHAPAYAASLRARARAGLARDGLGSPEDAEAEARRAGMRGEAGAAWLAIAEMWFALQEYERARTAMIAVPRECYRSNLRFLWRFRLWDLRVASCFHTGRPAEALRYAARIVDKMSVTGDPWELTWVPPRNTVQALSQDAEDANAAQLLRRIANLEDLDDWFDPETSARLRTNTRTTPPRAP